MEFFEVLYFLFIIMIWISINFDDFCCGDEGYFLVFFDYCLPIKHYIENGMFFKEFFAGYVPDETILGFGSL